MKKTIKRILMSILFVCILLIIILFFLQNGLFNPLLKKIIVRQASKYIEGNPEIEKISGNPLKHLKIINIKLSNGNDVTLKIGTLEYKISPKELLSRTVKIDFLKIDKIDLKIKKMSDGTLNLQHILISGENKKNKTEKTADSKISEWDFYLDNFSILNSHIDSDINFGSVKIPSEIKNINIKTTQRMVDGELFFNLKDFYFETKNPDDFLKKFSFAVEQKNKTFHLKDFILETSCNSLKSKGSISEFKPFNIEYSLDIKQINFAEIRKFIPDFPIYGSPDFNMRIQSDDNRINIKTNITEKNESININLKAENIFKVPDFELSAEFSNINIANRLRNKIMPTSLTGKFSVDGKGKEPKKINANAKLELSPFSVKDIPVDSISATFRKFNETANIQLSLNTPGGKVSGNSEIKNIFEIPDYEIKGKISRLDLEKITGKKSLFSDLNLDFSLHGKGISPDSAEAETSIIVENSHFAEIPVEQIRLEAEYKNGFYDLKKFLMKNNSFNFNISGKGKIPNENSLELAFNLENADILKKILKKDNIEAEASVRGKFSGNSDNMKALLYSEITDLKYDDFKPDKVILESNIDLKNKIPFGNLDFKVYGVNYKEYCLDSLIAESEIKNKNIDFKLGIVDKGYFSFDLESDIVWDSSFVKVNLPEIVMNSSAENWTGGSDSMYIEYAEGKTKINNFRINSGTQFLKSEGTLNLRDNSSFYLEAGNIDAEKFNFFFDKNTSGKLTAALNFSGTREDPQLLLSFLAENPVYENIGLQDVKLKANITEKLIKANLIVNQKKDHNLKADFELPIIFKEGKYDLDKSKRVKAEIFSPGIDLSELKQFIPKAETAEGLFVADIKADTKIDSPHFTGNAGIKKGKLNIPAFGVNLDYNSTITFSPGAVSLDSLIVKSKKGDLNISGEALFENDWLSKIKDFNFSVKANDFQAAKSKNFQLVLESDIKITGPAEKPEFNGNVRILRTLVNIDAFKKIADNNFDPILAKAEKKMNNSEINQEEAKVKKFKNLKAVKDLQGKFVLEIPKNSWIRGKNMNIEIAGKVNIQKKSNYFQLYGNIKILRGHYTLYGKRFDFKDSSVNFTGGDSFNADLSLKLVYKLRDNSGNSKKVQIKITGNSENPQLRFFLDNKTIDETDAVSYILFGKASDSIDEDESSELKENSGNMGAAANMLTKYFSQKLTRSIGQTLNLDVIEVNSFNNGNKASITAGKYVSEDIFVSYQKEFNLSSKNESEAEEFTVEYEIFRNIYLQAKKGNAESSGIDLIFKISK